MKYISKAISLSTLLVLSASALPVTNPTDKEIKIYTRVPDNLETPKWNEYCSSMKNFFTTTVTENSTLLGYDIGFYYDESELFDKVSTKDYESHVNSLVNKLKSSDYDIFVLDENFLFAENSNIQSEYVEKSFGSEIHKMYVDLTANISKEELSFHDADILSYGYYDNRLYALPYERDFDVLFYRNNNSNLGTIDMMNISWDQLVTMNSEAASNVLSSAIANDDEMLNLFVEYANERVTLSGNDKDKNYERLYNNGSKEIYDAFSNFLEKFGPNVDKDVGTEKAYQIFIDKQSSMLKSKASRYGILSETTGDETIKMKLLPKNASVTSNKYIVINNNSLKDKKVLIEAVKKLTSKEMQNFRAGTQFHKIPTFDINQRNTDHDIQTFANNNLDLLDILGKLSPLHHKTVFKSKDSPPYMEVRALLPQDIKKYNKERKENKLSNVLENTQKLLMDKANVIHLPTYILYAPIILFIILSIVVIVLIFKYRRYPCLQTFSPGFCILSIIGITMSIIDQIFVMEMKNPAVCKYHYIFETITTDLTLFPMVAVTYRLYTIYKSKAHDVKVGALNTRIKFFFIISMLIMIIYSSICALFLLKFYFSSYGTIDTYRQQVCEYHGSGAWEFIERRVNELIYIVMIVLIVKTGRVCKKYGAFKYIYIMFIIGIMEYTFDFILNHLPSNGYFGFYFFSIIVRTILYGLLIYYMVGSRLLYVIKNIKIADNLSYEELL